MEWKGRSVKTGIFKYPSDTKLSVKSVNIEGDDQADRRVHGGTYKAVYAYPIEHYDYFKRLYPDLEFHYGMFGENLTTEGLIDENLWVGDILEIGTTRLMVVQPRVPCFKLGIKFGTQKIVKQFAKAARPGFYLKIVNEGELQKGDEITYIKNPDPKITIIDLFEIAHGKHEEDLLRRAITEKNLPPEIRKYFSSLLKS